MKKSALILLSVLCLVCCVVVNQAYSWDSFRCNDNIININDYAYIVAEKCGENKPIHKEIFDVIGEHWVYDLGNDMYYYLKFRDKKLISIEHICKP